MSVSFYHCKIKDYGNGVQQIINYDKPVKLGQKKTYCPPRDISQEIYELSEQLMEGTKTMQEVEQIAKQLIIKSQHTKRSNTSRAKNKVYDLVQSNQWEWFITLTFDPEKINRTDYDECSKAVKYFIDETRRISNGNFKYIGLPEYHADGVSFHFHFLFSGIPSNCFILADNTSNDEIYNLGTYTFGFSTATKVRDSAKASGYIVKYITKTMTDNLKGKKRYWASRNLNKPDEYQLEQKYDTSQMPMPVMEKTIEIDTPQYKNRIEYKIYNIEKLEEEI